MTMTGTSSADDDQYKQATQVVAEAMRTDALGPALERVLREHLPTNKLLKTIMAEALREDVQIRDALEDFCTRRDTQNVGRRTVKVGWQVAGAVIVAAGASGVTYVITQLH